MEAFALQVQEVLKVSPMGLLRAFHLWFNVDIVGIQERKLEKALPWKYPLQRRKYTQLHSLTFKTRP